MVNLGVEDPRRNSCSESLTVDDAMGGLLTRGKDASGRIQFCSGAYAAAGIHGNGKLNTATAPAADADVQTKQHRPVL